MTLEPDVYSPKPVSLKKGGQPVGHSECMVEGMEGRR